MKRFGHGRALPLTINDGGVWMLFIPNDGIETGFDIVKLAEVMDFCSGAGTGSRICARSTFRLCLLRRHGRKARPSVRRRN
jgi:hypothetical protein